MTAEEKRKFLKRYGEFAYISRTWSKRIEELKLSMLPSGIKYSDLPKHSFYGDKLAEYMARLDQMAEEYLIALTAKAEIEMAINKLAYPYDQILRWKYIDGYKLSDIALKKTCSEITIKKKCQKAIDLLILDEEVYKRSKSISRA